MIKPCLTWNDLDACATADDIAKLLAQQNIKGRRKDHECCPLANASGHTVFAYARWNPATRHSTELTPAECEFVERFDNGEYPDLDASREQEQCESVRS